MEKKTNGLAPIREKLRSQKSFRIVIKKKAPSVSSGSAPIVLEHEASKTSPKIVFSVERPVGMLVKMDIEHVKGLDFGGHNHQVDRNHAALGALKLTGTSAQKAASGGSALAFTLPGDSKSSGSGVLSDRFLRPPQNSGAGCKTPPARDHCGCQISGG